MPAALGGQRNPRRQLPPTLARVPPHRAWKHPGLPTEWTPVLEPNEEALDPEALPGYVWLDLPGEGVLHVPAADLEFKS